MGYVPDAAVVELMTRVRQRPVPAAPTATLAWINTHPGEKVWHDLPWFRGYLEGARARAAERGYALDEFWLKAKGMTPRRLDTILRARGIKGVLVPPPAEGYARLSLDWARYAGVAIESNLYRPALDRVAPDYFGNTEIALRALWHQGARRIGLWIGRYQDVHSRHAITGAFLSWQARLRGGVVRLAPMIPNFNHATSSRLFSAWYKEHRPDAVVCIDEVVKIYAQEAGLRVPEDLRLAHLNLHPGCGVTMGIAQRHFELGAVAVDMLVGNVLNGRFGVPPLLRETVIVGEWRGAEEPPPTSPCGSHRVLPHAERSGRSAPKRRGAGHGHRLRPFARG